MLLNVAYIGERRGSSLAALLVAIGAIVPLVPWFFGGGRGYAVATVIVGALAALGVGGLLSRFTGRHIVRSAIRQLFFAAVGAAVAYGIGSLFGVSTS